MKIHYLATSNIPSRTANALQIIKMCEAISKAGHSIRLILPNLKTLSVPLQKYYDLKYKIDIIKVGKIKKYIQDFDNIIIPLKIIHKSLKLKSDLIITRSAFISLVLIFLKKKHIFEIHDDLKTSGSIVASIYKNLRLLNSHHIIKVIFISLSLQKFIKKNYFYKRENFDILHDATEIKNKYIKFTKSIKLRIGYFGSIYKSRGIELIIKLAKRDKKNDYFIYGGTKNEIQAIRKKNNINNLFLKSQISYTEVKKEIIKMDVLLMPYTKKATISGDYGNIIQFMSPMKMFDYLGSSKIILCANIPVLREILIDNYNSILINNYMNVNSWKIIIDNVIFNQKKYLIMRKNALLTASENNWDLRFKKMLQRQR